RVYNLQKIPPLAEIIENGQPVLDPT
ncbi:MAG: hypothetical protein SCARUB_03594, partial [Candidatus Scalindua rubra]